MIQKTTALFCGLVLIMNYATAQSFKQQFNDLITREDSSGQQILLEKWEQEASNDPELFVAYFNYYVNQSRKDVIALGQRPKGKNVLQVMDQDTANKEPVAYMYDDTYYNPDLLSKGFNWINRGIEKHPNRLDMRFGKIYMFSQIEDYGNFTKEIIKTIDYSAINNNKWTWADSKPVDDPKDFMLSSIQSYQIQLYNTNNDDLLENMKEIAEAVLKHYPEHVESLSNLAIVLMLQDKFDKALEILLKAQKLNPKDYIILNNIAHAYKVKGDVKNAIKYYELTIKHGDDEAKKFAREQIEDLQKNSNK